jgi:L-lysine 4-chlorinase
VAAPSSARDLDQMIEAHTKKWLGPAAQFDLRNRFARDGFVLVPDIVPSELKRAVRTDVEDLLARHAERRDLLLRTTGDTPRFMSVVKSELIAAESELITALYACPALLSVVAGIAGERPYPCPSKDEEYLITKQERAGDTHGWHWGDFSFALIWIIETPDIEEGGMLQCVPHTRWDKSNPQINRYLCASPINTYGFVPGDIYLLRTDSTLHRTVPLRGDALRIILNMTWASAKDLRDGPSGDDRWWEDSQAGAATEVRT